MSQIEQSIAKIQNQLHKVKKNKMQSHSKSQQTNSPFKKKSPSEATQMIKKVEEKKRVCRYWEKKLVIIQDRIQNTNVLLSQLKNNKKHFIKQGQALYMKIPLSNNKAEELKAQRNLKIRIVDRIKYKIKIKEKHVLLMENQKMRLQNQEIIDPHRFKQLQKEINQTFQLNYQKILEEYKIRLQKNEIFFEYDIQSIYAKYFPHYEFKKHKWLELRLNDENKKLLQSTLNTVQKRELIKQWIFEQKEQIKQKQLQREQQIKQRKLAQKLAIKSQLKKKRIQLINLEGKLKNQSNEIQMKLITLEINGTKADISQLEQKIKRLKQQQQKEYHQAVSRMNKQNQHSMISQKQEETPSRLEQNWANILKYRQQRLRIQNLIFKKEKQANGVQLTDRIDKLNNCIKIGQNRKGVGNTFDIEETRFYIRGAQIQLRYQVQDLKSTLMFEEGILSQINRDYKKIPQEQEQMILSILSAINTIQETIDKDTAAEKSARNQLDEYKKQQDKIRNQIELISQVMSFKSLRDINARSAVN